MFLEIYLSESESVQDEERRCVDNPQDVCVMKYNLFTAVWLTFFVYFSIVAFRLYIN